MFGQRELHYPCIAYTQTNNITAEKWIEVNTSNNGFYVMMRPPWWCHIYQLFCFKQLTELVGHVDCHKALKLFHTHTPINIPHNAQISRCLMGNQMSTWLFQTACTTQDWLHEHFIVGKSCDYVTRIIIKTHPNQPTKC